ncbi:hypothetical protein A3D83_02670 [Candidatus Daviesbacteria bacterium RIFCSPHIGHO2_02_FULL_41_10]|uniref:Uncharacterized protein n=1 Tax=Candidatus Daviesbacteria bacterium RIFCSPHIGHO2_02_FULL_41_10 TaxID=1797774 RepID=A0A1F5JUM3_9BACT|nr:MAG: hypothetical protein A3D83_02670 [Candidatus Daviesbacteria bacterium RIFCSPHIGHO2_02_FULL_41_10]
MSALIEQIAEVYRELRGLPTPDQWNPVLETRGEQAMRDLLERLHRQGLKAKGRVGYLTTITTGAWHVRVVDQARDWRMIVSSYQPPESIPSLSKKEAELLDRAINSSGFANNPNLAATRGLIGYAERMISVPPGCSPVLIAEEELLRRMVGIAH